MTPMTRKPGHHEQRLQQTQARLNDALERLRKGRPVHPLHQRGYTLTVAALAREAGVARNAIYTNHRAIIDDLHAIVGDPMKPMTSWQDKLGELRGLIDTMKQEQRRLVSENALLLQRALSAEAEADRHRRHNARLIAERDTVLRAVPATVERQRTVSFDDKPEN
jgi:AcrR family transcriptional regulator